MNIKTMIGGAICLVTLLFANMSFAEEMEIKFEPLDVKSDFVFAGDHYDFEVLYFFSYACPYCYQFHPYIEMWKEQTKKENTSFSMIPVEFQEHWEESAKTFEVARNLDIVEETSSRIFDYMHEENKDMFERNDVMTFFQEEMGVERDEINKYYNSFSLNIALNEYREKTDHFQVQGTPTIILITRNGSTFLTSPNIAETPMNMIATIDYIIDRLSERYQNEDF